MFCALIALPVFFLGNFAAAQSSSPSVVCVAGQCVQGFSNISLGAILNTSETPTPLLLLPGQYTTSTDPQLLHDTLTASGASLSPFPGFENASQSYSPSKLPLTLDMSPGLTIYEGVKYSGKASYSSFPDTPPTDTGAPSIPLTASSLALSQNVYAVISANNNNNSKLVFWDSVPDINQIPSFSSQSLSLLNIVSTTCNPPCSGNSICSFTSQTCICAPGFTGTSCETCAPGFFGRECQPCPGGCEQCDEGIQGTGRCLKKIVEGAPEGCGCVNGKCVQGQAQCSCNAGWTTGDDGKLCAKCDTGFFKTSSDDCQVCQNGCAQCADVSGTCTACQDGFTLDLNDNTKCVPVPQVRSSSNEPCPLATFSNGNTCTACSSVCQTCKGPSSNDCTECVEGRYMLNGACVGVSTDGVCEGTTNRLGNNAKGSCDACPSKCTSCVIPGFNIRTSSMDQLRCTGCLPGFVLSQDKCVESCPTGTFLAQDNLTCTPCDSSCGTCSDSPTFCLTCSTPGQLAFQGKCLASCPSNTFTLSGSGSCATCHGDCASCSGPQFNQCTSCPPNRPVLSNGRCMETCPKGEFLDPRTSACGRCDSSCGTCDGAADRCLSCPGGRVLRQGKCVTSENNCQVLNGLGVCLEELVVKPQPNATNGVTPIPSITGIADPTTVVRTEKAKLEWWQVLLMALGVAFCALVVIVVWRRRARKKRIQRTREWARERGVLGGKGGSWWRRIFARRERNLGHPMWEKERRLPRYRDEDVISELSKKRQDESLDMGSFIDAYRDENAARRSSWEYRSRSPSLATRSLYSTITGERRRGPEPREPLRQRSMKGGSARSMRSLESRTLSEGKLVDLDDGDLTEAEKYIRTVRNAPESGPGRSAKELDATKEVETQPYEQAPFIASQGFPDSSLVRPMYTGQSNNPFRR